MVKRKKNETKLLLAEEVILFESLNSQYESSKTTGYR